MEVGCRMDENRILEELITLLEKNSIPVKQDRGDFKGGLIRYHDEQIFYMNRKLETATKIKLIFEELKNMNISKKHFSEELRQYLDSNDLFSEKNSVHVTNRTGG